MRLAQLLPSGGLAEEVSLSSLQQVLDRCREAGPSGEGWQPNCPARDDNVASLSIAEGNDGRATLHCRAGCSPESICEAVEITVAHLFPRQRVISNVYSV